jgi:hypothetical protein
LLQGLGCAIPGIRLPAVVGACRILLHAWELSDQQGTLEWLLMQLLQALCDLEGQYY